MLQRRKFKKTKTKRYKSEYINTNEKKKSRNPQTNDKREQTKKKQKRERWREATITDRPSSVLRPPRPTPSEVVRLKDIIRV